MPVREDDPGDLAGAAADAREQLIEALADVDDAIAEPYLDGVELAEAQLRRRSARDDRA